MWWSKQVDIIHQRSKILNKQILNVRIQTEICEEYGLEAKFKCSLNQIPYKIKFDWEHCVDILFSYGKHVKNLFSFQLNIVLNNENFCFTFLTVLSLRLRCKKHIFSTAVTSNYQQYSWINQMRTFHNKNIVNKTCRHQTSTQISVSAWTSLPNEWLS